MGKLKIIQGVTFFKPVRWGGDPILYLPVQAVTSLAPLRLTVPGHGVPRGWRCELASFKGLTGIESSGKGEPSDYHYATVVDTDTLEFNDINASSLPAYVSGGIVKLYSPVSLSDKKFTFMIWNPSTGETLFTADSDSATVNVDTVNYSINIMLTDEETASFSWKKAEYAVYAEDTINLFKTLVSAGLAFVEPSEYL